MTRAIVALYLTTSTADAFEQRGARGAAVIAAAGSIGMGAEWMGVHRGVPFGPYDYSGKLGRRSRMCHCWLAPLGAARPPEPGDRHWATQPTLVTSPRRRACTASLRLPPRSPPGMCSSIRAWCAEGYWRWPGGGRYEGIPATNYLGWLATGAVIFAVAELIDPDDDPVELEAGSSLVRSGDAALTLYLWTWVGELIANVLLWRRPARCPRGWALNGGHRTPGDPPAPAAPIADARCRHRSRHRRAHGRGACCSAPATR